MPAVWCRVWCSPLRVRIRAEQRTRLVIPQSSKQSSKGISLSVGLYFGVQELYTHYELVCLKNRVQEIEAGRFFFRFSIEIGFSFVTL